MRTSAVHVEDSVERLVVVSDLHAYSEPLRPLDACVAALPGERLIFVNGDLFEGGISPRPVVDWVCANADGRTTRGNHDAWVLEEVPDGDFPPDTELAAYRQLSPEQLRSLRAVPEVIEVYWRGKRVRLIHGHLTLSGEPGNWQWTPDELIEQFGDPDVDLVLTAHTHFACVLKRGDRFLANSGSVAAPFVAVRRQDGTIHYQSGDPSSPSNVEFRSSFLSVTEAAGTLDVEIVRFDYDREAALSRLLAVDGRYPAAIKWRIMREGIVDLSGRA